MKNQKVTKLHLRNEHGDYNVSANHGEADLVELCDMFERLLLAAGYSLAGHVTIIDEDKDG